MNVKRFRMPAAIAATAVLVATGVSSATPSPAPPNGAFQSVPVLRVLDSANHVGTTGPIAANKKIGIQIAGLDGIPATGVSAVLLNVAASASTSSGSITVYASGTTKPAVPNLYFGTGQHIADTVVVPLGSNGVVDFYDTTTGTVQLTADVSGYYAPAQAPGSTPVSYTATLGNSDFVWNSQYAYGTTTGSYTEYFTRYYNWSIPAITQDILDNGQVQVYFVPSASESSQQWVPLPYSFTDGSGNFDYITAYETSLGQVRLHFFFVQRNPSATIPTLSTWNIATTRFKVVVTPGISGDGAAPAAAPAKVTGAPTTTVRHGNIATVTTK
ncbi:MAG: polysaccharide deacetylase [Jatrophihabitans sp.]|nr:polysaccharide deacetylase [Jatrophihabitans sp.]